MCFDSATEAPEAAEAQAEEGGLGGGGGGGGSDSDDLSKESALKKRKYDHDDDKVEEEEEAESVQEEEYNNKNSLSDSSEGLNDEEDEDDGHGDDKGKGDSDGEDIEEEDREVEEEAEEEEKAEEESDDDEEEENRPLRETDSDSESDYETEELRDEFRRYNKQIIESEGFDVDFVPKASFFGGVRPVNLENDNKVSYAELVKECVAVAIKEHNEREGANLQLERIVKANHGPAAGRVFYITFQARESSTGPLLTYQTKVFWGWNDELVIEVLLFRPKREAKAAN